MRMVYVAQYPVDGDVIKTYLEANGVPAVTLKVHNASVGISLMYADGVPTVWVLNDEDEPRALQLIEQRGKDASNLPPWQCERCEEENDGPFGVCWKCGASAPPLPS